MKARLSGLSIRLYGGALLTAPWIGVGTVKLITGRDLGAGFQPAYLLLAVATAAALAADPRPAAWCSGWLRLPRWWRIGALAVTGAVLLSGLGLVLAPTAQSPAEVWGRFAKQVIQLAIMGVFVLWPAVWTRGPDRWRWTARWLVAGALCQVGYGLLQGVGYDHPFVLLDRLETVFTSNPAILAGSEELYLGDGFRHVPRLRGTAAEPLYLGNYLLLVWPFVTVAVASQVRRRLVLALLGLLLLATWSRGAWLALVPQILVWVVLQRRRHVAAPADAGHHGQPAVRLWWVVAGVAAAVLVLGALVGWDRLLYPWQRLVQTFSRHDWSNLTRLYSMQAGWRAFLLSPIVGIGWGQFAFHFPLLVDPLGLQSQFAWPVVNNFPLAILCETGVIGFLVFTLCLGGLAGRIWRQAGRPVSVAPGPDRDVMIPATVAAVGVLAQLLTFSQWNLPHIWLALGLLLAATAGPDTRCEGRNRS